MWQAEPLAILRLSTAIVANREIKYDLDAYYIKYSDKIVSFIAKNRIVITTAVMEKQIAIGRAKLGRL